jgi:CheY-like chemotaxis protein
MSRLSILVVEDELYMRDVLTDLLSGGARDAYRNPQALAGASMGPGWGR